MRSPGSQVARMPLTQRADWARRSRCRREHAHAGPRARSTPAPATHRRTWRSPGPGSAARERGGGRASSLPLRAGGCAPGRCRPHGRRGEGRATKAGRAVRQAPASTSPTAIRRDHPRRRAGFPIDVFGLDLDKPAPDGDTLVPERAPNVVRGHEALRRPLARVRTRAEQPQLQDWRRPGSPASAPRAEASSPAGPRPATHATPPRRTATRPASSRAVRRRSPGSQLARMRCHQRRRGLGGHAVRLAATPPESSRRLDSSTCHTPANVAIARPRVSSQGTSRGPRI